jgi:hypothetical protein
MVVTLAFVLAVASTESARADEVVEIFNGKDLTGWTKRGGDATYAVENGEIVGRSVPNTPNTFLTTDKEFGDFVLELDFKIHPKDFNSGVQIRSHARPESSLDWRNLFRRRQQRPIRRMDPQGRLAQRPETERTGSKGTPLGRVEPFQDRR